MNAINDRTLERLNYFVAVAESGSFETAGEKLALSPQTLFDAFDELERELEVTLALRTLKTVRLTDAGRAAYQAASATLVGMSALEASPVTDEAMLPCAIVGNVAIVIPSEPATHWLPPRLAELKRHYPDLTVHVHVVDGAVALRDSGYEVGVRGGYQLPGVVARNEALRLVLAARQTPAIDVSRHGLVLKDLPLLSGGHCDIAVGRDPGTGKVRPLQAAGTMSVNNRDAAIAMARNGLGAVLATEAALAHDFATGALVPVLADWDFGSLSLTVALRDETPSPAATAVAEALGPTAAKRRRGAIYLP